MSKKLTPWFPDMSEPARQGYYLTSWLLGVSPEQVRYWNGEKWCPAESNEPCSLQCFHWRGLAKKP